MELGFRNERQCCGLHVLARLRPTESAVLFSLEPVLAAVLSVVWLKESMTPQQVFGGVLIVVAMIVSEALPYMFRAITVPDTRP